VSVGASRFDEGKTPMEVGNGRRVLARARTRTRTWGISSRCLGRRCDALQPPDLTLTIISNLCPCECGSENMAPFLDGEANTDSSPLPRFLVVGAGSRGNSYARALQDSGLGIVAAVADPIAFKRKQLGARYIWRSSGPQTGQDFADWKDFVKYEKQRRDDEAAGLETPLRIDGAFICVLDHQHVEVASALGPLGLHIMCEKPLGMSSAVV
jgi:hypothetical protein